MTANDLTMSLPLFVRQLFFTRRSFGGRGANNFKGGRFTSK